MSNGTIHVRFVDADSGRLVGEHAVPAAQIPESFEAATTLDIGPNRFEVVSAEPVTRAEALSRGFITLRLRKIEIKMVDPKELLCSLPSISNELPPILEGSSKAGHRVLTIHEDDWRQVELLSPAGAEAAAADLAAIADIHSKERAGPGFRKLHVRKAVPEPLAGASIGFEGLAKALHADPGEFDGLAFEGVEGRVEDGFALRGADGIVACGRASAGIAREIMLLRASDKPLADGKWFDLAFWISNHRLLLVDWCRVRNAGDVPGVVVLLTDLWPVAGLSPGRIFLGLPK